MGALDDMKVLERVPISKPPFEYNDLKKAIPPHCFRVSLKRSFYVLFHDLFIVCTFYYIASNYIHILPIFLSFFAWPIYWLFLGAKLGGLWMLAHECGHQSLFNYRWLDDSVGFLLHSFLLTPYFSFKFSHRTHHTHTNSIEYDESHVPKRKSDTLYNEILHNPIGLVFTMLFRVTLGYPSYFIFNYGGRKYDEGFASHLNPQSPIFKDSQRGQIFLSDVGVSVVLYAYYQVIMAKGSIWALYVYGIPWFVMGAIVTVLTYLQHNHPSIPHYDSTEWTWMRGALSAIDRDIGFMVVKNKTDHHVVHHLFPAIPRYHLHEATEALKPILGDYYKYDGTPTIQAFWREMKECIFVEPDDQDDDKKKKSGVYWFRK